MENDYIILKQQLEQLKKTTQNFSIGKSVLGEDITCFVIGDNVGLSPILVQGAIHAREYITSFLIIKMIEYLKNFAINRQIFFVPLVNPDGVRICFEGYEFIKDENKRNLIKKIIGSKDRRLYKANANGVDLNVNFDANWATGKQNIFSPAMENFVGYSPNSEQEVRALIDLTNKINPILTLSYHSKGEVIYYGYKGQSKKTMLEQKKYLKILTKTTGYLPIFTSGSAGGYKDWCLLKKDIVGFTIEVGKDYLSHPISSKYLQEIFDKNKQSILKLLEEL